jgi:hypothetical protein
MTQQIENTLSKTENKLSTVVCDTIAGKSDVHSMPIQAVTFDLEWPQSKESTWRSGIGGRRPSKEGLCTTFKEREGRFVLPWSSSSLAWLVRTSSHRRSCAVAESGKVAAFMNSATTMSDLDDGF